MASQQKTLGALLAVVALALTGVGVAFAATDSNPSSASDASLALHGQNPKSAEIAVTISTGQQYDVTGTVNLDFQHNAASASLSVPTVFSTTTVRAIYKNQQLFVGSSALNSVATKSWTQLPGVASLNLFPIEAELAKAQVDVNNYRQFLGGLGADKLTTTHNGPFTTYSVSASHFAIPAQVTSKLKAPKHVSIDASVTVASEGQLAGLTVSLHSSSLNLSVSFKVLSYNAPITITAPPANQVQHVKGSTTQILGSKNSPIGQLLSPQQILRLHTIIAG